MADFNPDSFLQQVKGSSSTDEQVQAGMAQTTTPNVDLSGFDPDAFLNSVKPLEHVDGTPVPQYADGSKATSPINESPLSVTDRFKLSLGNEEGKINYLKGKYEEVAKDSEGDLVVKDQGKWKRVDAKDPWLFSSEIAKDMADAGGMVVQGIGAVAAEAGIVAATGGIGAIPGAAAANAAGAGLKMTMGRFVGTYQATPEEEMRDLGFEALLGAGGQAIGAGIKPAAKLIGDKLIKAAPWIERVPESGKAVMSQWLQKGTGASENVAATYLENPSAVGNTIKAFKNSASTEDIKTALGKDNLDRVGQILTKDAPKALNGLWKNEQANILEAIESSDAQFNLKSNAALGQTFAEGLESGVLSIERKSITKPAFTEAEKAAAPVGLNLNTPEPTLNYEKALSDVKEGKLAGYSIKLKSQNELVKMASMNKLSPALQELVIKNEGYGLLNKFWETTGRLPLRMQNTGADAAKDLMNQRKVLNGLVYELGKMGEDQRVNSIKPILTGYINTMDTVVKDGIDAHTEGAYSALLKKYGEFKGTLELLDKAKSAAKDGDLRPIETMLNQIKAPGGKFIARKNQFQDAMDLIIKNSSNGENITKSLQQMDVNNAATHFSQAIRPGIVSKAIGPIGAGAGIAATLGNPGALAGVAGTAAVTSPRLNDLAIKGSLNAARKIKEFTLGLKPSERLKFLQNPQMMNAVFSKIVDVPNTAQAMQDHFTQSFVQQQGQPGQQ